MAVHKLCNTLPNLAEKALRNFWTAPYSSFQEISPYVSLAFFLNLAMKRLLQVVGKENEKINKTKIYKQGYETHSRNSSSKSL